MRRHRRSHAVALLTAALVVTSCAASKDEFVDKAQDVIVERFETDLGLQVTATCEAPTSVTPGSTFTCTANAGDTLVATFLATITDSHEVVLTQQP